VGREFQRALQMMRRRDPQTAEDGFALLRDMARAHVGELIEAFEQEHEHGLRCWLLELIGEARSVQAFDVLATHLVSEEEALRGWAQRGLRLLDTKDARRLLWQQRQDDRPGQAPASGP
jgi:hypothetical protein